MFFNIVVEKVWIALHILKRCRKALPLDVISISLNSFLRFEEMLGCGLALHLTLLKDLAVRWRFLLKEFNNTAFQLASFVAFTSLRRNRDKVPLFLTMTGRKPRQVLKNRIMYVREELKRIGFLYPVS